MSKIDLRIGLYSEGDYLLTISILLHKFLKKGENIMLEEKNFQIEAKFKKWKDEEDQILREHGWSEEDILNLREEDHSKIVDANRRYKRHNKSLDDPSVPGTVFASYDKPEINSFLDLLNCIENEAIFKTLVRCKPTIQLIIMYKLDDYPIEEIALKLHMKPKTVYKNLDRLKQKYNFFKNNVEN